MLAFLQSDVVSWWEEMATGGALAGSSFAPPTATEILRSSSLATHCCHRSSSPPGPAPVVFVAGAGLWCRPPTDVPPRLPCGCRTTAVTIREEVGGRSKGQLPNKKSHNNINKRKSSKNNEEGERNGNPFPFPVRPWPNSTKGNRRKHQEQQNRSNEGGNGGDEVFVPDVDGQAAVIDFPPPPGGGGEVACVSAQLFPSTVAKGRKGEVPSRSITHVVWVPSVHSVTSTPAAVVSGTATDDEEEEAESRRGRAMVGDGGGGERKCFCCISEPFSLSERNSFVYGTPQRRHNRGRTDTDPLQQHEPTSLLPLPPLLAMGAEARSSAIASGRLTVASRAFSNLQQLKVMAAALLVATKRLQHQQQRNEEEGNADEEQQQLPEEVSAEDVMDLFPSMRQRRLGSSWGGDGGAKFRLLAAMKSIAQAEPSMFRYDGDEEDGALAVLKTIRRNNGLVGMHLETLCPGPAMVAMASAEHSFNVATDLFSMNATRAAEGNSRKKSVGAAGLDLGHVAKSIAQLASKKNRKKGNKKLLGTMTTEENDQKEKEGAGEMKLSSSQASALLVLHDCALLNNSGSSSPQLPFFSLAVRHLDRDEFAEYLQTANRLRHLWHQQLQSSKRKSEAAAEAGALRALMDSFRSRALHRQSISVRKPLPLICFPKPRQPSSGEQPTAVKQEPKEEEEAIASATKLEGQSNVCCVKKEEDEDDGNKKCGQEEEGEDDAFFDAFLDEALMEGNEEGEAISGAQEGLDASTAAEGLVAGGDVESLAKLQLAPPVRATVFDKRARQRRVLEVGGELHRLWSVCQRNAIPHPQAVVARWLLGPSPLESRRGGAVSAALPQHQPRVPSRAKQGVLSAVSSPVPVPAAGGGGGSEVIVLAAKPTSAAAARVATEEEALWSIFKRRRGKTLGEVLSDVLLSWRRRMNPTAARLFFSPSGSGRVVVQLHKAASLSVLEGRLDEVESREQFAVLVREIVANRMAAEKGGVDALFAKEALQLFDVICGGEGGDSGGTGRVPQLVPPPCQHNSAATSNLAEAAGPGSLTLKLKRLRPDPTE